MKISVVVPVRNGGEDIIACLAALSQSSRVPEQIIVVDDSSTDDVSIEAAKLHNFEVVELTGGPVGPAKARNEGVLRCTGDLLIFVDADVVFQSDTIQLIEAQFSKSKELGALFCSYDDKPLVRTHVSLYKNLLHHYVHQQSASEAKTFWSGCGAIKKSIFEKVGGFSTSYGRPSIEDIELGVRMHEAGFRILLCPQIQVQHRKHWTLSNMVKTDIFSRAVPWTRLMNEKGDLLNDLNVKLTHRISAGVCLLTVLSLMAGVFVPLFWAVAALLFIVYVLLDLKLFTFFAKRGGFLFGISAAALHFLYYLYSSITFVMVNLQIAIEKRKKKQSVV